ncbi:MAG: ExbD/TolR family protein [Gemmataceae bacterium]
MAAPKPPAENPDFTPLLDLVLNLIMFFMITANYVQVDKLNQEITLPVTQSSLPVQTSGEELIYLSMDSKGKLVGKFAPYNSKGKSWEALKTKLARMRKEINDTYPGREPNIVIILRADQNARHGDVYDLLDACSRVYFESWQLRVKKGP